MASIVVAPSRPRPKVHTIAVLASTAERRETLVKNLLDGAQFSFMPDKDSTAVCYSRAREGLAHVDEGRVLVWATLVGGGCSSNYFVFPVDARGSIVLSSTGITRFDITGQRLGLHENTRVLACPVIDHTMSTILYPASIVLVDCPEVLPEVITSAVAQLLGRHSFIPGVGSRSAVLITSPTRFVPVGNVYGVDGNIVARSYIKHGNGSLIPFYCLKDSTKAVTMYDLSDLKRRSKRVVLATPDLPHEDDERPSYPEFLLSYAVATTPAHEVLNAQDVWGDESD